LLCGRFHLFLDRHRCYQFKVLRGHIEHIWNYEKIIHRHFSNQKLGYAQKRGVVRVKSPLSP